MNNSFRFLYNNQFTFSLNPKEQNVQKLPGRYEPIFYCVMLTGLEGENSRKIAELI